MGADEAAMLAEARAVARQAHLFEGAEGEIQIERGLPRGKERRALAGLGRSRYVIGHPLAPFGEDRREWAKDVGGERACSGSENRDGKPVGATGADTAWIAAVGRGGMHEGRPRRMRSGGVFGRGRDQRSRGSHRARCEAPSSVGVSSLTRRARTQLGRRS